MQQVGWKVLDLGRTALAGDEVRRHAHPVMSRLAAGLRVTTHLAVLDAGEVVYVDKVAGKGAFAVPLSAVGKRLPRIRKVTVRFGEPLDFDDRRELRPVGPVRRAVTDEIMDAIAALSQQERASVYNEGPKDDTEAA